ncbi:M23 family metallopeptidase [Lentiprolixibacter aurantiacus]|uniref:M23 family metallopeptidase n=1 Tax=Lentiprolixibacter aurantiacus TaxID=2993939 RepID=A0AAE3SQ12_9FLAO|nr:M23 family metallopeptidase [Lentiprolixibacter aurantiacus]MCX2720032.1 M23 family metallopeptidase [Lentiprolixibacter aurantiacus]
MRVPAIVLFLLSFQLLLGQSPYPKEVFRPPLDIPLILAGTFGELRSNHFHSGIDIKTQQRQGLPVYAIADGTVTRIKISHWGYGKALYIAHPNGYTSVYAHLQKFAPEIEQFVKQVQYQKQSYEVEIFPDFGEIKVNKDSIVAYTGNTGGSSGPHLHFEIRNSVNEKPTNPLLYGLEVRDATNPSLVSLHAYPLSEQAQVNQSNERVQLSYSKQADGTYLAEKVNALGTIGFGVNAFDRQDLAANKNGVFAIEQRVNGKVYTDFDFDSFSFSETRYINTLIDYAYFGRNKQRIQQCFKAPGNKLSIYETLYNDGKIEVKEGLTYNVEIDIKDLEGNTIRVIIPVEGVREPLVRKSEQNRTPYFLKSDKPNNYDLGIARVYFPENTFYKDFYLDLQPGQDTVRIHNNRVPAHKNFTIAFDASGFSPEERQNLFIAHLDKDGKPQYMNTYKNGTSFSTRTRILGTYTMAQDTVPPKIRPRNFKPKQWLTNYRYLSLRISDDLSGINSYKATLNGEWILMEYEPKTSTLTYNFDDVILDKKQCQLEVVVTDNAGNSTTFSSSFFRR